MVARMLRTAEEASHVCARAFSKHTNTHIPTSGLRFYFALFGVFFPAAGKLPHVVPCPDATSPSFASFYFASYRKNSWRNRRGGLITFIEATEPPKPAHQ